jgi:SAM-dependent methyltransferase
MAAVLIFHVREARRKAMRAAVLEATRLLGDLEPRVLSGGPLGDRPGIFWLELPEEHVETARGRLARLGYTDAVDMPDFDASGKRTGKGNYAGKWKGRSFVLSSLYEEDAAALRERAPDRRPFVLPAADGTLRAVYGYRGDSGPLSRRGLPVVDAKLLVNLVEPLTRGASLFDPFAGAGGIVLESVERGLITFSADIDPMLRHGLRHLGARHVVADARHLPFPAATFDAVATEPPYTPEALDTVIAALGEIHRVLVPGGRCALMVAASQAGALRSAAETLGISPGLDLPVDRKGLPVVVIAW